MTGKCRKCLFQQSIKFTFFWLLSPRHGVSPKISGYVTLYAKIQIHLTDLQIKHGFYTFRKLIPLGYRQFIACLRILFFPFFMLFFSHLCSLTSTFSGSSCDI